MGLYGSKDQHPKLADTNAENQYLKSIEWIVCKSCGQKHLKEFRECPYCTYRRKQPVRWKTVLLIVVVAILVYIAVFGEFETEDSTPAPAITTSPPQKIPTLAEQLESLGGNPIYIETDVSILTQCGITSLRNAVLLNDSGEPDHVANYIVSYGEYGELYITFTKGSMTNLTFAGTLLYNASTGIEANINDVIEEISREKREADELRERQEREEALLRQQQAEAEAKRRAEEAVRIYKESCSAINYDELARNPDKHAGERYTFTGKIMQVQVFELLESMTALIYATKGEYGFWEDLVYVSFPYEKGDDMVLEGDIVTVWGECEGAYKYITLLGAQNIVPKIEIEYFEMAQ